MGQSEPTQANAVNPEGKVLIELSEQKPKEVSEKEKHFEAFKIHFKSICSDLKVMMRSYGRGEAICDNLEKQLNDLLHDYLIEGRAPIDTTPTKEEAEASIAPLNGFPETGTRERVEVENAEEKESIKEES